MTLKGVTMKSLLEAGVHFGHQKRRWNPKMKKYIFVERSGIYIIDLQKTLELLGKASDQVNAAVKAGGLILFVGTKKQAKDVIKEEARRCGMPFVTEPCTNNLRCLRSSSFFFFATALRIKSASLGEYPARLVAMRMICSWKTIIP